MKIYASHIYFQRSVISNGYQFTRQMSARKKNSQSQKAKLCSKKADREQEAEHPKLLGQFEGGQPVFDFVLAVFSHHACDQNGSQETAHHRYAAQHSLGMPTSIAETLRPSSALSNTRFYDRLTARRRQIRYPARPRVCWPRLRSGSEEATG